MRKEKNFFNRFLFHERLNVKLKNRNKNVNPRARAELKIGEELPLLFVSKQQLVSYYTQTAANDLRFTTLFFSSIRITLKRDP
jgi:hypothetical protein